MKLYEILDRDPRTARLANNGQARITDHTDEKTMAALRWELETFVCEGQFGHALEIILERFLGNLDRSKQDSAWVSGFFGSGKSHLLKMVAHLWVNTDFQGGATARNLVQGGLPDAVNDHLRELDTHARRTGMPAVAASGTLLGGNNRVRETVLAVLFRATGWPEQYPQAMFCFWLRDQGWLEAVRSVVETAGREWLQELNNLYVSPHIRRALLQVDPNLAPDEKGVGQVLRSQFPQLNADITTPQFTDAAREALLTDGELPLTLVVLDEVQQYINEASDRGTTITEVAEALQTSFDSRVMLVGAGQSALAAGTPALMWLRDRFSISIQLADADVETVIRKVLLRKKPSAVPDVDAMLEANSGEIARHLNDTRIASRPEDRDDRTADYPLLPTRRRFWEACFQAVDAAGTQSQLRSQLRILHDALREIADRELGVVLPASVLFNALAPSLVNTGVLLNELNTRIQKLDNGTDEGCLRRDLCGLVFLIGELPHETGVDLGVRADATTVADLIVDDVSKDSGPFRNAVAKHLEALADEGTLMKVGQEYLLQTTEGAEWDRAYREKQASLRQNEVEIATRRGHIFSQQVRQIVGETRLTHGAAKLRRNVSLHIGGEAPRAGGDHVTVWLRDGWSTAEKEVVAEARRLGQDDPTLHVALPRKSADELRDRIIDTEAARQVLDHNATPSTDEGRVAHESMGSRLRAAESARDEIVREVVRASRVFQSGGNEVFGESLADRIRDGAESSLARLFPRFGEADHRAWEPAVRRVRDGSDEPFKVVGWDKPTEDHPVAKQVLAQIGAGARGSEVQKELKAAPYGWPQDAIDAALIAMHHSGHLRATQNGQPIGVGRLDQAGVKAAEFRLEKVRLTTTERIAVRGLYEGIGVTARSGEEELQASAFLESIRALASRAGGEAPLPTVPSTRLIDELSQLTEAEQLGAFLSEKDTIERLIKDWNLLAGLADERVPAWESAALFRRHAAGLPILDKAGAELDAILEQRSLLADTDHITPLVADLARALREALTASYATLVEAVSGAETELAADATWMKLDAGAQGEIRTEVGLATPPALATASDEQLRATLDARPLSGWQAEIDATGLRVVKALEEAATRLRVVDPDVETTTVSVRRGTLSTEADVEVWLDEHGKKLKKAVAKGPVIVK